MDRQTVLVTGATNGIGLATAKALARAGHHVVVHGRNAQKTERVVDAIRRESGDNGVSLLLADLSSLAEVRRMAAEAAALVPHLDVLINNAGCAFFSRTVTRDGYEATFAVNHLAPFLLTHLLLDKLKAAPAARIVNVASESHRGAQFNFDDLMTVKGYRLMRAYGRSKLANILFTRALAKRLLGTNVTVNALHPGVVNTGIAQNNSFARMLGRLFMPLFTLSPAKGAKTSVYLATSPQVAGKSGGYYKDCSIAQPSADALNDDYAERLWHISEQLVGVRM